MLNTLDFIVLVIIGLCVLGGYRRGFILTVYGLVSFFLCIIFTMRLYPYMSRFLAQTALYEHIKEMVINSMGLQPFIQENAALQAADLINNLPLPAVFKEMLLTYNTPDMYTLLNVTRLEDYIGGFFANIAINIISMVLVFVLVWLLLRIIGGLLNIIGHLPIINTLNRIGGLAAGFVLGLFLVWLGLTLMSFLFATPANPQVYALLENSWISQWLYENNFMLNFITNINI
jgi:uncharacterized membrane protein required for colicin V production